MAGRYPDYVSDIYKIVNRKICNEYLMQCGKLRKKLLALHIKQAKEYINLCRKMNLRITKAILFGSQATGTAHGDSDIDLLLVSDIFKANTLDNWKLLAPVTARLFNVEPHPYPEKNFLKGDPFIDEIKRTGIEIKLD